MLSKKERKLFARFNSRIRGNDVDIASLLADLTTAEDDVVNLETIVDAIHAANISEIRVAEVAISSAEIVGTASGDLGHTDGTLLVAAPGTNNVLQFLSAVVIYDFDTAAYTGAVGDDLTIRLGTTAVSPSIATADLLTSAVDAIVQLEALSAVDIAITEDTALNLHCTEVTQPGTAAGVIRVKIAYRVIATGLGD